MSADYDSPIADPGRRLLARLIETLLQGGPALAGIGIGFATGSRDVMRLGLLASAAATFVVFVLSIVWLHRYGQSVGKRILGLRIVRANGERAGLTRLFLLRELLPLLVFLVPWVGAGAYFLDRVVVLANPRRCLHDYLADTIVVDCHAGSKSDPAAF